MNIKTIFLLMLMLMPIKSHSKENIFESIEKSPISFCALLFGGFFFVAGGISLYREISFNRYQKHLQQKAQRRQVNSVRGTRKRPPPFAFLFLTMGTILTSVVVADQLRIFILKNA